MRRGGSVCFCLADTCMHLQEGGNRMGPSLLGLRGHWERGSHTPATTHSNMTSRCSALCAM